MEKFLLMMAAVCIACFIALGYLLTLEDVTPSDCMSVCQVDGMQYKPRPVGDTCWCDLTRGVPLTDG